MTCKKDNETLAYEFIATSGYQKDKALRDLKGGVIIKILLKFMKWQKAENLPVRKKDNQVHYIRERPILVKGGSAKL